MSDPLIDQLARERFRTEWQNNFAVSANAGSGKTTAISERLAAMALSPDGAAALQKTAVVTYTKKAAAQIGQKARQVLLRRLEERAPADLGALDHLERAFFGTIHSFCLVLAQRYGQPHGLNLNPRLVVEGSEDEEVCFEEFLAQDAMGFSSLPAAEVDAFLRFVPLEDLFETARSLGTAAGVQLAKRRPSGPLPHPSQAVLDQMLALPAKGSGAKNIVQSQAAARRWMERFSSGRGFLPLYEPVGKSKDVVALAEDWMAPLRRWLADAAAALTAELAGRYRAYRAERGVQTYADQVDSAMTVLQDATTLDRIRADGWRVILDEAQDTDSQQFAVLVEIARPPGATPGTWPEGRGLPPRAGHFCLVGDGQQAIYRARADIRNFLRHIEAYERGDGGEKLVFQVTFRAPRAVVGFLNDGLPEAFGSGRSHNLGLPPEPGAPEPRLQVDYVPLEAGPRNAEGRVEVFSLEVPAQVADGVSGWMAEEARQLAVFLAHHGPASVGATNWGEVCVLAPRNDWLAPCQAEFEKAGLKTALQSQRGRSGDNPAHAWLAGLLAVICSPEDDYEWFGVLREVFAVSDAMLAVERGEKGAFQWTTPELHPEPLASALAAVRPWILRVDDEGRTLAEFAQGLAADCGLAAKAEALDASGGGVRAELERLLAQAGELGATGAGPREWFRALLAGLDETRATGKPQADAVNLLTCHSAKGLEWPVVITVGFWRQIGERPEFGVRLIGDPQQGGARLFLNTKSIPAETAEARRRERWRELVRLLYVTLTRAQRRLVIPWNSGFGTRRGSDPSFAEIWGAPERLEALPRVAVAGGAERETVSPGETARGAEVFFEDGAVSAGDDAVRPLPALPTRLLPHQLAQKVDLTRGVRHETTLDQAAPGRILAGEEAIDYGVWWHETLEHTPWQADEAAVAAHWAERLVLAGAAGFRARGEAELGRLRRSEAWAELRSGRWALLTELAVFSPLGGGWIDGVMDLVLHDAAGRELWVVDWKTNRARGGETGDELLVRLAQEYAPQLSAYGRALAAGMPGASVRLWVYSSVAGGWREVRETPS